MNLPSVASSASAGRFAVNVLGAAAGLAAYSMVKPMLPAMLTGWALGPITGDLAAMGALALLGAVVANSLYK